MIFGLRRGSNGGKRTAMERARKGDNLAVGGVTPLIGRVFTHQLDGSLIGLRARITQIDPAREA